MEFLSFAPHAVSSGPTGRRFLRLSARMPTIAFTTANYVARETGWAMHGWAHGDGATQEYFRPLETYAERLEEILSRVRALGFDALDLWGAHLGTEWATEEHAAIARETLERRESPPRRVCGLGHARQHRARVPARPGHRHRRHRRRLLRRARGTRAITARARGPPRRRKPPGEDTGRDPREDRARCGDVRHDGGHGLVGDTGLRRRTGDLRSPRPHRARALEGRPRRRRAARHLHLG